MIRQFAEFVQHSRLFRHRARASRIGGMAGDAKKGVFRKRTRCPRKFSRSRKPAIGVLVVGVEFIAQRDEHIDVEKVSHSVSSRSFLTISDVTIMSPGLRGKLKSGTPLL